MGYTVGEPDASTWDAFAELVERGGGPVEALRGAPAHRVRESGRQAVGTDPLNAPHFIGA